MRIERAKRLGRGSVLLHVMLTGVVVALIAATLLRMTLLRYQMGARSERVLKEKRDDQGALAAVMSAWNANISAAVPNPACSATPAGFTCAGIVAGTCGCSCTQTATGVTVSAAGPVGGPCHLALISPNLQ